MKTRARTTAVSPRKQPPPARRWSQLLGEGALLFLVVAAPLAINTFSRNMTDIKDAVLGLGVFLGLSLWFVASLAEGRFQWPSSRVTLLAFAYVVWAAVGVGYSQFRYVSASDFGRLASCFGLLLLTILTVRTPGQVRRLVFVASLGAILMCLYAFCQFRGYDPLGVTWTNTANRIFSFAGNATYLGGYLLLLLPLLVAVGWPEATPGESLLSSLRRGRTLYYLIVFLMAGATLALSFSFGSVGGFLLGAVYAAIILLLRGGRRVLRPLLPVALAAILLVPPLVYAAYPHMPRSQRVRLDRLVHFQDPSSTERQLQWRVAYGIFRDHPVIGEGFSAFRIGALERMAKEWYRQRGKRGIEGMLAPNHAHNEFLQVLADSGLVGGVLFGAFLLSALALAFGVSLRHPDPQWRRIGLASTAAMIGFLFQNLFGITFRMNGAAMFFWLWLGLLVVAAAQWPRSAEGSRGPRLRSRGFRRATAPALVVWGVTLAAVLTGLGFVAIRPLVANVLVRYSQLAADKGLYPEALAAAQRTLELCPYSSIAYYTVAYTYGQRGEYGKAVEASEKALALLPGNGSAYYNLAITYKQWGKLEEAAANLEKAIDLMPVPMHYIAMAEVRLQQGRLAEAEQFAQSAVERQLELAPHDTKLADFELLLADICARQGKYAEVAAHLQQGAQYRPGDANIERQLVALLQKLGRANEARAAAEAWAAADPKSSLALSALGGIQYDARQYQEAAQTLTRAVLLDPSSAKLRLNLAFCYAQLRDLPRFRQALEALVALGGDNQEVKTGQELLAKLPR